MRQTASQDRLAGLLLAGPATLGLVLFLAVPFVAAIVLSFTSYRSNSPLPTEMVGLRHYIRLFQDESFRAAILNTLTFAAVIVPVQTMAALLLAMMLNQPLRGMAAFRTMIFLPVVYPMALVAVVWGLIFAPEPAAAANAIVGMLGIGSQDWLKQASTAMPGIILMSLWQGVGFQMVVMLAALQGIPQSLYEAARVDGANALGRFVHITLPQMRGTITFVMTVTAILAFRLFDQVHILTRGGPANSTTTLLHRAYVQSGERGDVGGGAAVSVFLFVLVAMIAVIAGLLRRRLGREG